MRQLLFFLILILFSLSALAGEVYVEKKQEWNGIGKLYDAICVINSQTGEIKSIKNAKLISVSSQTGFVSLEDEGTTYKVDMSSCYLEQKEKEPVARMEFLDSIHTAQCDYSLLQFDNANFRLLNLNKHFVIAKRLTDGAVFAISHKLCSLKMSLPRIHSLSRGLGAVHELHLDPGEEVQVDGRK